MLEIASGSGYHVAAFAAAFPQLRWQPTDPDTAARESIAAHIADTGLGNIAAPLLLDVTAPVWPITRVDVIVCINMIHISPWAATLGLFAGAARLLPHDGLLVTYGPYRFSGDFMADSNVAFDQSLKARNPAWGIRDVDDIQQVAKHAGFELEKTTPMPANNFTLTFRKTA